jgi:serine/threonine-protein kinase
MDYGFEGDAPYLVMELLEGEDLGQRLHRVKRMNLHDTAKVLVQVGKALRKAHEAGIAHRDLKPANLFIARIEDEEVVKILDFGIAKDQHSAVGDATKTGEVIGSPHYMSPEQVRAEKDLDYRTDLWSLGIILYRMLVGVLPFPGDQLGPVLAKILTEPMPVPSQAAPDLPVSLDPFFARALARDKLQRFQSIAEMVDAFQAAAGGKDAFGSISMSLGTGQAVGAGGTALWIPPAQPGGAFPTGGGLVGTGPQTGPRTGPQTGPHAGFQTGPHAGFQTGPHTGSTAGLASTGVPPKSAGPGVVIAIVAVLVTLAGLAAGAFFVFRSPSTAGATPEPAATASVVVTAQTAATAAPLPSELPTAASSADPSAAPSTSASAAPSTKATGAKPKSTGGPVQGKPKEKWF